MGSTIFYDSSNELATLGNTFSVNSVATDPTAVTLDVTSPTGTTTQYTYPTPATLTRVSTGVYSKDVTCSEPGTWTYEWNGTNAASDTERGSWFVSGVDFQTLYCTPAMLKSRTGISDSLDDAEILGACESVSRWIDEHCDRVFARRTVTRQVDICGQYSIKTPDLVSVTTLKTDDNADGTFETTWSASDYELQPVNAALEVLPAPYTSIAAVGSRLFPVQYVGTGRPPRAQIVGVFGWPSIPAPVAESAAILATDYLAAGGTKFGVIGFEGFAMRARLNPLALSMLAPYRKYAVLMA